MAKLRHVDQRFRPRLVVEGAGVHLHRAFGFHEVPLFDPFLLFDDFRCQEPRLYQAGFPWHPHRGIITVTYMLTGSVDHGDSLGNRGVISAGEVQWMTSGSGIVHQEMPAGDDQGNLEGFQLWINLPARFKMVQPTYFHVRNDDIPLVDLGNGFGTLRPISGRFGTHQGPVRDDHVQVRWFDVHLNPHSEFCVNVPLGEHLSCYGIHGEGLLPFRLANGQVEFKDVLRNRQLFLLENGEEFIVRTHEEGVRFFLFSGRPFSEPVAWSGPVVMNTQEEIDEAFFALQRGDFIQSRHVGQKEESVP